MKILLIDGNSIMNRGYFALPKELTNKDGLHTNAILGFLNIFFRIYEEEQPDHIAVAFDVHAPTFRHEMYADYKGTRKHAEPEMLEQFPVIKDILRSMGISMMEQAGLEADDLLGSMAKKAEKDGYTVTVLSGDRDLLQLATERICIRIPKTKAGKTTVVDYHAKEVEEEYGVSPAGYLEMKGLMGDSSDNIPGVQGVGPKTAEKLIKAYGTVENLLANVDQVSPEKLRNKLQEQAETARFSRILSEIRVDAELPVTLKETEIPSSGVVTPAFLEELKRIQLYKLLARFSEESGIPEVNKIPELTRLAYDRNAFEKALQKENIQYFGFAPLMRNGFLCGILLSGGETVFLKEGNEKEVLDLISEWNEKGYTAVCEDLKELLSLLPVPESADIFDCRVAAYLINPLTSDYGLSKLLLQYRSMEGFAERNASEAAEQLSLFPDLMPRLWEAQSAYAVSRLYEPLSKALKETGSLFVYEKIEHPLTWCLVDMEQQGIRVSKSVLEDAQRTYEERLARLREEIYSLAGEEFNILSPKQLGQILFEKLELPAGKKTKSGYSTNVDVLEKLRDRHPIIPGILEYRKVSKLLSTYAEGLLSSIRSDGRIHTTFQQTVTATGRISSVSPNLQNLPQRSQEGRDLRKAFIPADGYIFTDADYSQIELRVMAALAKDPVMTEAFLSGEDIHTITASQVFHVAPAEVDSLMRRRAKAVNFGIIYGISAFGLGEDLSISREEAKDYIASYFEHFAGVKAYLDSQVENAKKEKVVKTLFGRIRPMPELSSSNYMQRSFGERVAMNAPIQGTAADIIKLAMVSVRRELRKRNLKSRLILQIHDELLIETAMDEQEEVGKILEECMMQAADIGIPLSVDMHTGENLYEAK